LSLLGPFLWFLILGENFRDLGHAPFSAGLLRSESPAENDILGFVENSPDEKVISVLLKEKRSFIRPASRTRSSP
jgi:hypothetical protein